MTVEGLAYVKSFMEALNIPYAYQEWTDDTIPERYWIGEYQEVDSDNMTETGYQETSFYLSGFARGSGANLILEKDKQQIKERSTDHTAILESGSGIAISYGTGKGVRTNDAELKRIDITLNIKEWRVNEHD